MRWLLLTLLTMGATGCAGFKAVDRGQWKLVYVDSAKRDAEAPREVVTRETYDAEVAEGVRRGYEPPVGFGFPLLQAADGIGLKVGRDWIFTDQEVRRLASRPKVGRPAKG
jgi:hypothetical protein